MSQPIITLTTDFGTDSPYVAIMKGVILSINPDVRLVDITHAIPPQDVRRGAQVLAEATRWYPRGTLHVAVVDPGVGTDRKIVYLRTSGQQYIAPDNGLLSLLARGDPPLMITALAESRHWLTPVSATFHGRDIMAPVAARLSLGLNPELLGPRMQQLIELQWPEAHAVPGKIEGCINSIDSFGNLITNISSQQLEKAPTGDQVRIVCGDHETFGIFRAYGDQPEMTLIALVGSSGQLELAIVGDSAALMLGEKVGTPVVVTWPND